MEEKRCFVYMVRCADGSLYTGWTNDLRRRLAAHNAGKGARYTRSRRPVRLVWAEPQPHRSAALRREAEVKAMSRAGKLALVMAGPPPETEQPEADREKDRPEG